MKPYEGFKAEKANVFETLPAGGYVGRIQAAKEKKYSWGSMLEIAFDIIEGEYTGFFKKQFDASTLDGKKWKGVCRISVPSDSDENWKKVAFNNFIYSVQQSNSGYTWNWDEKTLKGKLCGFIFNNFQYDYNGKKIGWSTECKTAASVDDIRDGNYKIPKDRPLKKQAADIDNDFTDTQISDDDIPW